MTPGYKKIPYREFIVAHSEDIQDGRTLIMKTSESHNKSYEVDVIIYEIDNDGLRFNNFGIIPSDGEYKPHPDGFDLSNQDRQKIISALFKYGIKDER